MSGIFSESKPSTSEARSTSSSRVFYELRVFSESEIQKLRKSEVEEHRLIQEQPRAHEPFLTRIFRRGFTLQFSPSAQHQCSRPSEYGPGVELCTTPEPDRYIVSTSVYLQASAGIVIQHKTGAVIEVACDPVNSINWHLLMNINTQMFVIDFGGHSDSSGHSSISLGDSAIVPLENDCEHQIRLVPTYFPLHRQDANIQARYIHRASCSGDWIPAEERCSWGHGYCSCS